MMENQNCMICTSSSIEAKCLIFSIKKKLKSLLNDYAPDFSQQEIKQTKNNASFVQMLKIVFGDKYFSNPLINKCSHQKICRYLKRKFKCDSKTFQQLCDQLSLKIGEKNFHFQVLTCQIKALSQTQEKLKENTQKECKQIIKTSEAIQLGPQQKIREQNNIENGANQIYNYGNNQIFNQGLSLQYPLYFPYVFYFPTFPFKPDNQGQ